MKKVVLTIAMLVACIAVKSQDDITFSNVPELNYYEICTEAKARNDTTIYITQSLDNQQFDICLNRYDCVVLHAVTGCNDFTWGIGTPYGYENSTENPIYLNYSFSESFGISFNGCGYHIVVIIEFIESNAPNETTDETWIHGGELAELQAVGSDSVDMYSYLWNTGETESTIYKPGGEYIVGISDFCATSYRTKNVKESVEIYRATVDLETKLNKVTWQTTPEQAEYVSEVKVERDGMVVGTVPYEQGYFLDNIGSENAARNYRLTAIAIDGTECPIPSYQKGTLHVDYSPNASNPNKLNMAWTPPFIEEGAPISVSYFQICKYDPETNEVTVVDQLGANNTIGSYDVNLFDRGYATVAAVFSTGKDYEELSFSNLTEDILGVGENEGQQFRVYPIPARGTLFVETFPETSQTMQTAHVETFPETSLQQYRIMTPLGQILMQGEITTEKQQIDVHNLSKGVYFITVGCATLKFVVE